MSDYIEYDDFGIVEVRCMSCKIVVAGRTYIEMPDRLNPGKKVNVIAMKRHSNWSQIKVDLSDDTYADPICCKDCLKGDIDLKEIEKQMKTGWRKELVFAGHDKARIVIHDKRVAKLKIKGRIG
jgi:hypothetical protein